MGARKPRVAFFSFACCEGCQLEVLSLEEELPALLEEVDIVEFREAMTEQADNYDISFIEGSITREEDKAQLYDIRKRSKVVVALGACAAIVGINAVKNSFTKDEWLDTVYGKDREYFEDTIPAVAIDEVIPVEYKIHGCPINKYEFVDVVKDVLLGKKLVQKNYPVCVECKLKGNVCMYDIGRTCLGPIIRAGCGAACPTFGGGCEGCRGLVDDPNRDSAKELLASHNLTVDDIMREFSIFLNKAEEKK